MRQSELNGSGARGGGATICKDVILTQRRRGIRRLLQGQKSIVREDEWSWMVRKEGERTLVTSVEALRINFCVPSFDLWRTQAKDLN